MTILWVAFAVFALGAIWAGEKGHRQLFIICKPSATLALLVIATLSSSGYFDWLISAGLLFSLGGDIALLSDKEKFFSVGLALFLVTHVFYTCAFLSQAVFSRFAMPGFIAIAIGSTVLTRKLWPRLNSLRIPVIIYAFAITLMVAAAFGLLAGPLPERVALVSVLGALLFYLSDTNLSLARFYRNYPHAQSVTLGLYWTGQLGIALACYWTA